MVKSDLSNIDSNNFRNLYFQQRREYKRLIKQKQRVYLDNQKQQLWAHKSECPKMFWKKLNKGKQRPDLGFSTNQLFEYFDKLLVEDHFFTFESNQEAQQQQQQ